MFITAILILSDTGATLFRRKQDSQIKRLLQTLNYSPFFLSGLQEDLHEAYSKLWQLLSMTIREMKLSLSSLELSVIQLSTFFVFRLFQKTKWAQIFFPILALQKSLSLLHYCLCNYTESNRSFPLN